MTKADKKIIADIKASVNRHNGKPVSIPEH